MATPSLSRHVSSRIDNLSTKLLRLHKEIGSVITAIEDKHCGLARKMITLEQQGIVEASPSYHGKKYLYLIYPMRNGKRKREYIGSNPKKVREAERKIANYQKYRDHFSTLNSLEHQAESILRILERVIRRSTAP